MAGEMGTPSSWGDLLTQLTEHSRQTHKKLWEHNSAQDARLAEHERRIGTLELKEEEA